MNKINGEQGSAVVVVMIFLILMILMGFGFITMTDVETSIAHNESDYVRTLYVAEAGISECLTRTNYRKELFSTVNGTLIYPYVPIFNVVNNRGTDQPFDDLYWYNDRTDNNGNGLIDEWAEIDPSWTANIWGTTSVAMPTPPPAEAARTYNYYPTILDITTNGMTDLLRYSGADLEDFSLSIRYKKFNNGKVVFLDADGEFEQPVTCDQIGSPVVIIDAVGRWSTMNRHVQVEAYPEIKAVFDKGICGCTGVNVVGTSDTDSYNSYQGNYPAGLGTRGDIGSNSYVNINGDPTIAGSVTAGTWIDAGSATIVSYAEAGDDISGGVIQGEVTPYEYPPPHPCPCRELRMDIDMDYFEDPAHNDNATIGLTDNGLDPFRGSPYHLDLRGLDNLTLNAGTYYFDSISLGAQTTLTTNGKVVIYLRGSSNLTGGGIFNSSKKPTDLIIYSTAEIIDVGGTSSFYGAIYAPYADIITHGTNDFYGSFLGNIVEKNGVSGFHFDEALSTGAKQYFADLKKISWQEIQ